MRSKMTSRDTVTPTNASPLGRLSGRAGGAGLAGWSVEDWLVVGCARSCSHPTGGVGPGRGPEAEDFVGLTGLAPASRTCGAVE